jgi:hypothetical protein
MSEENCDKISNLIEFYKIIKDLLKDLLITFPDKLETIINNHIHLKFILNFDSLNLDNLTTNDANDSSVETFINNIEPVFQHCKSVFPEKFFDILYQNEDIFTNDCNCEFLPNIKFSDVYFDTTSIQTKETLWKYLQLILFTIITSIEDKNLLGNNMKLFEAINGDEFKNKLQDTIKSMENLFNTKNNDQQNNENESKGQEGQEEEGQKKNAPNLSDMFNFDKMFKSFTDIASATADTNDNTTANTNTNTNTNTNDSSNANTNTNTKLPSSENIHDHINNLINGKIGSLAKELAEETTKDLDLDLDNMTDANSVFNSLFKNPAKLMSLVNNISTKIDTKMKDGSIKESELLEEASSLMKNMKNMPGMENFDSIFKSMNLDQFIPKGGKFNNNAFEHMMDQNVKMSKMKERMRKKSEQNKSNTNTNSNTNSNTETNSDSNTNSNTNTKSDSNLNYDTKDLKELNSNLMNLMKNMGNMGDMGNMGNMGADSFIADILKQQNIHTNDTDKNPKSNRKQGKKKGARK